MARLIDADALIKALLDRSFYPTAVRRAIEKMPTIDAEPVVRCKDCRHYGDVSCPMVFIERAECDDDGYITWDDVAHDYAHDEGFCDYGERYTDDRQRKAD